MKSVTTILTHISGKRVALTLVGLMLMLALMYIYFVFMSVVHVVIRTEIQHDIKAVASEISSYERTYIASQHHVSEQLAVQTGYVAVSDKDFIDRTQTHLVLSVLSDVE